MLTRTLLFAAALLLTACPGRGGKDGNGPGSGSGTGKTKPVDAGVSELPERHPGEPLLPPEGIDPQTLACVYHAGADGYFTCQNGNSGTCFHFGGPCAPSDACMFDATSTHYKSCASIVEGKCASWGSGCTPANACMYDPRDGLHHTCDRADDGACQQWGGLCDPAT